MPAHRQKKSPLVAGSELSRQAGSVVVVVPAPSTYAGDLPDHSRARNLHQRSIGGVPETRVRIGTARVPYRAVVDEVRGAVGTEPDGGWPVDAAHAGGKRLLGF